MDTSVFDSLEYKDYLRGCLPTSGRERGARSRLARAMGCQTAFISKVLNGTAHFSMEHAAQISHFLEHSEEERIYFLLLVQLGRAGSKLLRDHYMSELDRLRQKRVEITERIRRPRSLDAEAQITYYSSWHYAAIHVLVSIARHSSKAAVAEYLKIPVSRATECLDTLVRWGVLEQDGNRYRVKDVRIHLGKDSPMLAKHHGNWRIQAINSLERSTSNEDLHYSSIITLSEADAVKIREVLLGAIAKSDAIMRPSREEAAFCLLLDYFRL